MTTTLTYKDRLRRIAYFFPFRLLLLHFKKNHLLLLCWLILFGYVLQFVSARYGIPYLILTPEYFGKVGFPSFFIVGFALGGFITAFNLYSYALHAFRFPFIATVARPFAKFSMNNGIIPFAFVLTYIFRSLDVQLNHEFVEVQQAILNISGFLLGVLGFILLSYLYFTRTNTDIIKLLGKNLPKPGPRKKRHASSKWFNVKTKDNSWHVETYLSKPFKVALARGTDHYEKDMIKRVLWQNHINGSIFEMLLILSFLGLGALGGIRFFEIPAGASIFMLFTMVLMLIAALFSWLKGWTLSILIVAFVGVNYLSQFNKDIFYESHAIGLDYTTRDAPYAPDEMQSKAVYDADKKAMVATLEKWKKKNQALSGQDKPKLVLVTVSGGGARSMLWTMRSLQIADSVLGGTLLDRTALLTGSSGGLISASYYRQLWYNDKLAGNIERYDTEHLQAVSQDMLNPVSFSLVTNDLFFRFRTIEDKGRSYVRDRGIAFEDELNANLKNVLDIRLSDMVEAEKNAEAPILLISPTCINDGRSLLISSSPLAFLTHNGSQDELGYAPLAGSIEYRKLLAQNDALNTKLTSALRMNATFPYIMPMVSLPTQPTLKIMDAGIRDNYGMTNTIKFIHEMKDWIAEHTSGVVVLQMRDQNKGFMREPNDGSLLARIFRPVGNVTGNMLRIQDMYHDEALDAVESWADFSVDVVPIVLDHNKDQEISLSWHLTASEKRRILEQTTSAANLSQYQRLSRLLPSATSDAMLSARDGIPTSP